MFNLSGKRFLITGTGSSNGIGFASARALQSLGAQVFITSLSDRVNQRATELNCPGASADLTDENAVQGLIALAVKELGGIDGVVNNAGMTSIVDSAQGEFASIDDTSLATWRKSFARNLDSAFLVTKAALPYIRKNPWGRVVMVSSATGPLMAIRNDVAYASAKAAMIGLVRGLALDEAPNAITVNAIAPGWVATESQTPSEALHSAATLGRAGTPDEMASAVAWLCTPGAAYVTGQMIVIDGANSLPEQRFLPPTN